MGDVNAGPNVAGYLEAVTELVEAGDDFGDIEDTIDGIPELTEDGKAALWLFALSKRDGDLPRRVARPHLSSVN